jgi:WW domain-binding protein 4
LVDDETPQPTTFEIEQMLKNKETKVGQWESVVAEPTGLDSASIGYRPGNGRAEHGADGEKETEGWKFQHKGKRPVRDPYDDDDFDPSTILKMRKKVKQDQDAVEPSPPVVILSQEELAMKEGALDREGWSGKIELTPATASNGEKKDGEGLVYQSGGGWVKLENSSGGTFVVDAPIPGLGPGLGDEAVGTGQVDKKDVLDNVDSKSNLEEDVKPTVPEDREAEAAPVSAGGTETATGGLFKKRRPPPSSRKK